jgi:transposase
MTPKLRREEIVTLQVLAEKGQSNVQIAQTLGVTEGTVRYHRRRQGRDDGRSNKPRKAAGWTQAINGWVQDQQPAQRQGEAVRPINVRLLYEWLLAEHGYDGSYQSVLRFVRARYPQPRLRPFRRVETPPGAQAQLDWGEFAGIDLGDGPEKVYAFVMVLSHSRKEAVIWRRRMDQLAWHHAHNEAFRRLGGIAAVLRIDNLKTGIVHGAGPWGQVNEAYRAYAQSVGFHIDACLPRAPEDKGKVENKVGQLRRRLRLEGRRFDGLADLQAMTDHDLERWACQRLCPATGLTVQASWQAEQRFLKPVAVLPAVFDVAVTRPVHRDCTVCFENRTYSVPFVLCGLTVAVRGAAEVVQILHDGQVVAEHPRGTPERIVLDPAHYEGPGNERVAAPVPLGKLGRRLQEIVLQPVEQRPLDLYAALAEVAR